MKGPYGFELNDDCRTCKLRRNGFFCQLSPAALKDLEAIAFTSAYPKDAVLFMQQQPSRGLYILCAGKMKLSVSSTEGKTLILRIAQAGEALGLMAAFANTPHEVTAEVLCPSKVVFIRRDAFLRFLAQHPETYPAIVRQLGAQYETACEQLRTVCLSSSAQERLAKFLLECSVAGRRTEEGTAVTLQLNHEEIGELIGTTRETVTRTLSEFRSRNLVQIQGATLLINNRPALESLVAA
jgi:CRP/FNR family transcriptional regulator, cyclic AMP receptor protein